MAAHAFLRWIKPKHDWGFYSELPQTLKKPVTYRSLLVFLDQDQLCVARTEVAIQLAMVLDCHLVGVAPTGFVDLPLTSKADPTLAKLSAMASSALLGQAQQATERFREQCQAAGVKSFDAVIDESDQAQSLVRHAHCSDLTVLTQADPRTPDHRAAQALVEQVVLYGARPTLILPYAGRFAKVGGNALVAWDDSREAARALSDALPLLRLAERVQVISWSEGSSDIKTLRPRLAALNQWLKRQGVSADLRVETSDIGIADTMLSRAADLSADLIVMGAYGHARWTERVLGGATRGLLTSMTVPVLMSH